MLFVGEIRTVLSFYQSTPFYEISSINSTTKNGLMMKTNLFCGGGEWSVVGGGDVNAVCTISVRKQLIVLRVKTNKLTFQLIQLKETVSRNCDPFLFLILPKSEYLDEKPWLSQLLVHETNQYYIFLINHMIINPYINN